MGFQRDHEFKNAPLSTSSMGLRQRISICPTAMSTTAGPLSVVWLRTVNIFPVRLEACCADPSLEAQSIQVRCRRQISIVYSPVKATEDRCTQGNKVGIETHATLACLEIYIWVVTILTEAGVTRGWRICSRLCSQLWGWFSAVCSQDPQTR